MKNIAWACLAGALYALAFPTCNLWPLAWFFALPLFFVMEQAKPGRLFGYGFLAGMVSWCGMIYWAAFVMQIYGELPLWVGALILLLFAAYLALFSGLFVWLAAPLLRGRWAILTVPGLWAGLELLRAHALTGFPWALLGYSQFACKPLIQVAEFGGVYLISALIMMVNVGLLRAWRRDFKPAVLALSLVLLCGVWGKWRMETLQLPGPVIKAGICQANIPQDQKWLSHMVNPTIDIYAALTRQAARKGAQLIAWPETACNFYLLREWEPTARIIKISREAGVDMLIGSPSLDEDTRRYYNRVWLMRHGEPAGWYDKIHLVPFGEYVPLAGLLQPFIGKLTQGVSDFSAGQSTPKPVEDIGVLICFESLFPDLARKLCQGPGGAAYLVNASNDAWYKTWSAPEQLLVMSAFRSVETRRYTVRPVNHGISAVIDPFGRITGSIGLLKEDTLVVPITKISYQSFHTRFGPVLAWIWGLLGCIAALKGYRTRKKSPLNA